MRKTPLACFLLSLALPACAQTTLSVNAQGVFHAQPDTAILSFRIATQDPSAARAYDQARRQAEELRQLFRRHGIAVANVHLGGYDVAPQTDFKTHKVVGYTVSEQLSVELTDFAQIGPLLDEAGRAGLPVAQSVAFTLEHPQTAQAAAIADAYRQARAQAEALAAAAGIHLGTLRSVEINSYGPPQPIVRYARPMMALAQAAPAPTEGFSPGLIAVNASVRAIFDLAP